MSKPFILIVEDDEAIATVVMRSLEREDLKSKIVATGTLALQQARDNHPSLILLDLGLPDIDGLQVLDMLKRDPETMHTPVIILTARGESDDKVKGLNLGADDYVTKPFRRAELLARVNAVMRRVPDFQGSVEVADLFMDMSDYTVKRGDRKIDLTRTEFRLLYHLAEASGRVVGRQSLLEEVWGYPEDTQTNTLDVFISILRRKLEEGGEPRLLHTAYGRGYVLREEE
jgi:DNA-binding response OmpR family regulator